MEIIIISAIIVAIAVFLMCFNIIFRKDGKFPETEIGRNKEMKKRGIICAKTEERQLWRKKGETDKNPCDGCSVDGCAIKESLR